jgi:DNA polymerase
MTPISQMRGKWYEYQGIKVLPVYHPAYLLRNPAKKPEMWEDMQLLLKELK